MVSVPMYNVVMSLCTLSTSTDSIIPKYAQSIIHITIEFDVH